MTLTEEQQKEAARMQRRINWPRWPYLPLVRVNPQTFRKEFAVLYASKPFQVAYNRNIFDLAGAKWEPAEPRQLVAEGWRVD